ncbi:MAG: hypothetical protein D6798_08270 [Deltaproteobacteria bacterium]|nr:MAG: hypothetical protein D6798_08270 [Deltaproteobacteria bacterium]
MEPQSLLIAALVLLALSLAVGWWWSAGRASRASRTRVRRALDGEAAAELLLEDAGYVVLDRQVRAEGRVEIDGREESFEVRADLLVEARDAPGWEPGAVLLAEVKTGSRAPDPAHPATRRQLLEYQRVFRPDGLLLVDVEAGAVIEVCFPDE